MKFNTALCLLLSGIALLLREAGHRRAATPAILLALCLPLDTLVEYILDVDLGADNIFAEPFIESKVRFAGRMGPNTATALAFSSCSLLFYTLRQRMHYKSALTMALGGSVVFALGLVPLIGYIAGMESAHTWGQFSGMALHTSVCLILLALSIVAAAWKESPDTPTWLALPVAISFLMVAVSIWQAVHTYEDLRFVQSLEQEADYLANRGTDRLTAFYAALDRIASRWIVAGGTPRKQWESDVENYIKAYPFLKAVEWVGPDSYLQWVIPVAGNEKAIGIRLNVSGNRADTAALAFKTKLPQVTQAVALLQGETGFLYMSPLFVGNRYDGLLVAPFTLDEVFGRILLRDKNGQFHVTITENDKIIFSNTPSNFRPYERWQKTATMKNKDSSWMIAVNPTPEALGKKNSALPLLVLLTGLLTSIFAAFAVRFAFRSRHDAMIVQADEERLRQIIKINSAIDARNFDLQVFMNLIVGQMDTIMPITGAVIELIEGEDMAYTAASGSLAPHVGMHLKRSGSLSGLCTDTGEVLVSRDTANDPRVNVEACRKVGAVSMAVVPLSQRGLVVGVLKVVSNVANVFQEQDLNTLRVMAGLLGGALAQELEKQLRHMAQYDSLTGLPNRTLFKDRLSRAIINNARNGNRMAVIYMDIDHFKQINDKYGHAEGDALLEQFSARVTDALRKGDTLARLGGDEFVAIVENLHNETDAELVAGKIVNAMQIPFALPTQTLQIGASLGVALSSGAEIKADAFLACADGALYEVKRGGRNGFKLAILPA